MKTGRKSISLHCSFICFPVIFSMIESQNELLRRTIRNLLITTYKNFCLTYTRPVVIVAGIGD